MLAYRPFPIVFTFFPSSRPPDAAIQKSRALSPVMGSGQTTPRPNNGGRPFLQGRDSRMASPANSVLPRQTFPGPSAPPQASAPLGQKSVASGTERAPKAGCSASASCSLRSALRCCALPFTGPCKSPTVASSPFLPKPARTLSMQEHVFP